MSAAADLVRSADIGGKSAHSSDNKIANFLLNQAGQRLISFG